MSKVFFGGGCFWGIQAAFDDFKGVVSTRVGFMGGKVKNPSYETVCEGNTNHAEVVEVEFDNSVSFNELLELFFRIHNPSHFNKQGVDVGTQYRSVVFYTSDEQKDSTNSFIESLVNDGKVIVTEVLPASEFWVAEEYHQKYYKKHKISSCN